MLQRLSVRNLVLVDQAHLQFSPGLIAITGETGAGKSLLLGSLGLITGERASQDYAGRGEADTTVEAAFSSGADAFDVRRTLRQSGKNVVRIDGESATLAELGARVAPMVEIHTQQQARILHDPAEHQRLLDAWLPPEPLQNIRQLWDELAVARRELARHQDQARTRAERQDWLRFQIEKLQAFVCEPGEYETMRQRAERLRHSQQLQETVQFALHILSEDEHAVDGLLGNTEQKVADLGTHLPEFAILASQLAEAGILVADVVHSLQSMRTWDDSPEEDPELLEEQLAAIERYARDNGIQADDQADHLQTLLEEQSRLQNFDDVTARLQAQVEQAEARYTKGAKALRTAREERAAALVSKTTPFLQQLALPHARLSFSITDGTPGPRGADDVQLYFQANPDLPARPIHRVASGGELSRVQLALLAATAASQRARTLILDEIDAGVGGETAHAIARTLRSLSEHHQVLTITHLPQVAAAADQHFAVRKEQHDTRTTTRVYELDPDSREKDIARMLGSSEAEASLALARDMLGQYHRIQEQ